MPRGRNFAPKRRCDEVGCCCAAARARAQGKFCGHWKALERAGGPPSACVAGGRIALSAQKCNSDFLGGGRISSGEEIRQVTTWIEFGAT